MNKEHELLKEIKEAQKNARRTDLFIEKYAPFIRSEVLKFTSTSDFSEKDDEFSIAMFAFYEALQNYDRSKGAFFPMARVYIRNRLIDYYRKTAEDEKTSSLDENLYDDEKTTLLDTIEDEKSSVIYNEERECTREEIEEFQETLKSYDLTLSEIADNAPRQERTMKVCLSALEYAKKNPDILDKLTETKKLPMSKLVKEGGFDRKTLERHRKYLVGIFLAFTNGFVIIRGHLCAMRRSDDE